MLTAKRVRLQQKGNASMQKRAAQRRAHRFERLRDCLRLSYPLKFDFCRMTLQELMAMMEVVIREDQESAAVFKPIVAIGHTKDLVDFETVESFLGFLAKRGIVVSTCKEAYPMCR